MVYCPNCWSENEDNSVFCQECGKRIKPEKSKEGLSKLIKWKALVYGAIAWLVLAGIFVMFATFIFPTTDTGSGGYILLFFLFVQLISGIITGFFSDEKYSSGILNGVIIGIIFSVIFLLRGGILDFLGGLVCLPVFGVMGGVLGVLIYRRTKL
jgi:uncharacterized membrane protein YeaQ/YmgE (transglycosylase-associated protein family)